MARSSVGYEPHVTSIDRAHETWQWWRARPREGLLAALTLVDDDPVLLCACATDGRCDAHAAPAAAGLLPA